MIDVEVEDRAWIEALPDVEALARAAAAAALGSAHSREGRDPGDRSPEASAGEGVVDPGLHRGARPLNLNLLLADDEAVRDFNARFRDKDAPTNVLSFPAAPSAAPHLGDVALAYGVCAREAKAQGKTLAHHLQHLVVHGVLHLLGSDHQEDAEAEEMEAEERAVLARLGVPDPYAAHPAAPHEA